jgi:hypothetical protein
VIIRDHDEYYALETDIVPSDSLRGTFCPFYIEGSYCSVRLSDLPRTIHGTVVRTIVHAQVHGSESAL